MLMLNWLDSLSDSMYWCVVITFAIGFATFGCFLIERSELCLRRLWRHWFKN